MNGNNRHTPISDCFNRYNKVKEDISSSHTREIRIDDVNEFFAIIDSDDCADYLRQFGNFDNSIKGISDFLYKKFPSRWINLLINKIFDNFTENISKNYDENLFKRMKEAESTALSNTTNHKSSLFIYIFLLISTIKEINNVKFLEKAILSVNKKNILSEKINIFIFWIIMRILIKSENIQWKDKKYIFWNWKENPYFNFFKKENFNTFELIYQSEIFSTNENISD